MRSPVIYFIGLTLFITSCGNKKTASDMEHAFIQSLKDGEFKILEPYFATREVYRSVATDSTSKSGLEVDSFLSQSNQRLKDSWDKILATVKRKNIDPGKVVIKETFLFDPFGKGKVQAMVVVYEYEGKTWDDLTIIVKQNDQKISLLEIPNPTDVFSFRDTSLRNVAYAKARMELAKPEFQLTLKDQVKQMIKWAKEDNLKEFSALVVYRGNDENRSWKSAVNMSDSVESELATGRLNKVKSIMKDCNGHEFGKIIGERESEGFWIIQLVNCGNKMVYFSFLKIKGKLLLGDIDTEVMDQ